MLVTKKNSFFMLIICWDWWNGFYLDGIVPDVNVILGNNLTFLVCTSFRLKFHIPHIIILIISPEIAHNHNSYCVREYI